MAAKRGKSIVDRKLRLTGIVAAAGLVVSVSGGLLGNDPLFYAGLILLALSPFISLAIVVGRIRAGG